MGIKSFQSHYGLDLAAEALRLGQLWEDSGLAAIYLDFTEADIDQMERMYLDGYGTATIAEHFGCLMGSVWTRLKKRGVIVKGRLPLPQISLHSHGYLKTRGQYVHRMVAEEVLGRPLLPGECVHHKNGDRKDNRPENLEVHASHSAHMQEHREERETWTPELDARLLDLLAANFSTRRIAQDLGFTMSRVGNRIVRLKKRGQAIAPRTSGRKGDVSLEARKDVA